jgi:hypothetical protein
LVVPFSAIKSFFDPSVQFALQFEPSEAVAEASAKNLPAAAPAPAASVPAAAAKPEPDTVTETVATEEPAKPGEGAEVVRLDRFRKK